MAQKLFYSSFDEIPAHLQKYAVRTQHGYAVDSGIALSHLFTPDYAQDAAQPKEDGFVYITIAEAKNPAIYRDAVRRAGGPERVRYIRE